MTSTTCRSTQSPAGRTTTCKSAPPRLHSAELTARNPLGVPQPRTTSLIVLSTACRYIIKDESTGVTAVVDPYDPVKLNAAAKEHDATLGDSLFLTHHHNDHS